VKVTVDTDVCIAAGTCVEHLPSVFVLEEGAEHVTLLNGGVVPDGCEDWAEMAIVDCPTRAILPDDAD
jgi:ferredoxin